MDVEIHLPGRVCRVRAEADGSGYRVSVADSALAGRVDRIGPHLYRIVTPGVCRFVWVARGEDGRLHLDAGGDAFQPRTAVASRGGRVAGEPLAIDGRAEVRAPMPARVVTVLVADGALVERDQLVVVVEAMKMQIELRSPISGRVVGVNAAEGALTDPSIALVVIEA